MKSNGNKKRSVVIMNKRTSVCLEDAFWHSLHAIVQIEDTTIEHFIAQVKQSHDPLNLSSSIRVAILDYFQRIAARDTPAAAQMDALLAPADAYAISPDRESRRQRDRVVQFWSGMRSVAPQGNEAA